MSRLISVSLLCVSSLAFVGATVYAQSADGIIEGTVTDASGAVIPNASVTITNKADSGTRTVTTNETGAYRPPALLAGEYTVKVAVSGFRTVVRDATVNAGGDITVSLVLSVGDATEVVTVEAASA